jgi:hypothetical protein
MLIILLWSCQLSEEVKPIWKHLTEGIIYYTISREILQFQTWYVMNKLKFKQKKYEVVITVHEFLEATANWDLSKNWNLINLLGFAKSWEEKLRKSLENEVISCQDKGMWTTSTKRTRSHMVVLSRNMLD